MTYSNNSFLAFQLKSGDTAAYDYVMNKHYKKLCAYAYVLIKNHAKAEDIVQNVMLKLWAKKHFINTELSIESYLYKSVYNGFINEYKKEKTLVTLDKKHMELTNELIEKEKNNLDVLIKKVHHEIDKLPPKCKTIFILNKKEGLTQEEIAEHLNLSIKTIEGHITRAYKILRLALGEKFKGLLFILFSKKKHNINTPFMA